MKTSTIIIVTCIVGTAVALAITPELWQENHKEQPPLLMGEAYNLAVRELGQKTNEYYFIRAEAQINRWLFTISDTNGTRKCLYVDFNNWEKRIRVESCQRIY